MKTTKRNAPTSPVHGKPQTPKAGGGMRIRYDETERLHHVEVFVDGDWCVVGRECEERDAELVASILRKWREGE